MIRVLVAASSAVARAGLESILARHPSVIVVGSEDTDNAPTITDEVAEHEPDVLLVERPADGEDIAHFTAELLEPGGATPAVVLLTDESAGSQFAGLLRSGVRALLPRNADVSEILAAVSSAAAGLVSIPADWFSELLPPQPAGDVVVTGSPSRNAAPLTPREVEVLRMIAEGLANKQIAARLGISDHTVKFHVASLFAKLHASTRAEAVMRGARHGMIVL